MLKNRIQTGVGKAFGEGNGTLLQYSCLESPMDGGAWQAAVHGVTRSQTRLRDFTFTFHFHALEKEMATHSSVLAWRIPGTEEPGGLPFMGSHRLSSSSSSSREGIPCTRNSTGKDMVAKCAQNTHSDESSRSREIKEHILEQEEFILVWQKLVKNCREEPKPKNIL